MTQVSARQRDQFPDILRGFALLGIALVNVPYLAIDTLVGSESVDFTQTSESITAFVVLMLFTSKFYLIFSFLFGYSAHYVIKDERKNRRRWIGRSVGLILLGILHLSLFFHGDILVLYGLLGLLLLAFYFRKAKTLKVWAWVLYGLTAFFFITSSIATWLAENVLDMPELPENVFISPLDEALRSGTFLDTIPARLELYSAVAPQGVLLQGPLVLVGFLVGVLAARTDFLSSAPERAPRMRRMAIRGLAIGLPLQALGAWLFVLSVSATETSYGLYLMSITVTFMTAPLLSSAYLGLLWLLVARRGNIPLLAAAGRHSLTIYLSQSLIFATLFSAWGFGLFGELNLLSVTLIAAGVWLVLAVLAQWNLRYRSTGPMEKVLTGFSRLFQRAS